MKQGFAFLITSPFALAYPPLSLILPSSPSPILLRSRRRSPILRLQLKSETLESRTLSYPISASSSPPPPPSTTTTTSKSSLTCSSSSSSSDDDDGDGFRFSLSQKACADTSAAEEEAFIVVNFYCFVFIDDPDELVSEHLSFLQGRDIRGRIYVNEQGINAQYSGPSADALAYVEWLKEDSQFSDILVQISPALDGHAFPRLKLRYKPSLVQLEGGISHLPLHDPSMRATTLAPFEWRKKLEAVSNVDGTSDSHHDRKVILLDVRNGYEWDIGHFRGAHRPTVDCFRSTSFGLSEPQVVASDPLAEVDKENTDVLMYCTGGIRCDIYSVILRQKGFQNLFTLKGGVSHYLEKEGPVEWIGNLFVFDSRLSLPPSAYNPEVITQGVGFQEESDPDTFARCYICRSHLSELRHRNCANLDCNRLYLCCPKCLSDVQGCCSSNCVCAPRLRPVLPGYRRYEKWHLYRDMELDKASVI